MASGGAMAFCRVIYDSARSVVGAGPCVWRRRVPRRQQLVESSQKRKLNAALHRHHTVNTNPHDVNSFSADRDIIMRLSIIVYFT